MQNVTTDERWEANRRLDADHTPDTEAAGLLCRTCGYGTWAVLDDVTRHYVRTAGSVQEVLGGRLRFPPGYPTPRGLLRAGAEHLAAREPHLTESPSPAPLVEVRTAWLGIADPVVVSRADLALVLDGIVVEHSSLTGTASYERLRATLGGA